MLTTMTTAENPAFASPFFSRTTLHQPCFKMKNSDFWDISSNEDDTEDALDLGEEEYKTETELFPSIENSSKRASRHLSGGGLLLTTTLFKSDALSSQFSGGLVLTIPQPSTSSDVCRISSNPFWNEDMRLALEAEEESVVDDISDKGCVFSSTNPFSIFHDSSPNEEDLSVRSISQCSTRAVSPQEEIFPRTPRPNSFIFALPAPPTLNQSTQTIPDSQDRDLKCLQKTVEALRASGWYYENVSWQDAKVLLHDSEPGTFLVRDSSVPQFLFSLSVQTVRGPTSVRLHYIDGRFRLDAEAKMIPGMPSFETVLDLVEYYIANTEATKRSIKHRSCRKLSSSLSKEQVWVDSNGQVYSHILLWKPLRKNDKVLSLKHLSRLSVNLQIRRNYRHCNPPKDKKPGGFSPSVPMEDLISQLSLPSPIASFLYKYPYSQ